MQDARILEAVRARLQRERSESMITVRRPSEMLPDTEERANGVVELEEEITVMYAPPKRMRSLPLGGAAAAIELSETEDFETGLSAMGAFAQATQGVKRGISLPRGFSYTKLDIETKDTADDLGMQSYEPSLTESPSVHPALARDRSKKVHSRDFSGASDLSSGSIGPLRIDGTYSPTSRLSIVSNGQLRRMSLNSFLDKSKHT